MSARFLKKTLEGNIEERKPAGLLIRGWVDRTEYDLKKTDFTRWLT